MIKRSVGDVVGMVTCTEIICDAVFYRCKNMVNCGLVFCFDSVAKCNVMMW